MEFCYSPFLFMSVIYLFVSFFFCFIVIIIIIIFCDEKVESSCEYTSAHTQNLMCFIQFGHSFKCYVIFSRSMTIGALMQSFFAFFVCLNKLVLSTTIVHYLDFQNDENLVFYCFVFIFFYLFFVVLLFV